MAPQLHYAVLLELGTNPTEFNYCRLRLREAGLRVTVVGREALTYALEDHSMGQADTTAAEAAGIPFDGVVIPGGLGPEKLRQDPRLVKLVSDCHDRGGLCAAICHGQHMLISAALLRGVRATAAWSMQDDLRAVGAIVPDGERAVRDGQIITAIFPNDLPAFFDLILAALADGGTWLPPEGYPRRLAGQTWGIVVDDATDGTQVEYLRLRVIEEGGQPLLLGRRAGASVRMGSPTWEWGEMGWSVTVDRALPNPGVISSCDTEADANAAAITVDALDGLLLPGGLGTWQIRGHPGLRGLLQEMAAAQKPIGAVGRGPKLLLMTGILAGKRITCAPQMRDDVVHAVEGINYVDAPAVRDGALITCQGTEALPAFMRLLLAPGEATV